MRIGEYIGKLLEMLLVGNWSQIDASIQKCAFNPLVRFDAGWWVEGVKIIKAILLGYFHVLIKELALTSSIILCSALTRILDRDVGGLETRYQCHFILVRLGHPRSSSRNETALEIGLRGGLCFYMHPKSTLQYLEMVLTTASKNKIYRESWHYEPL
jgi:hypothetical protein